MSEDDDIDRAADADRDPTPGKRFGDATIVDHWPCRDCRTMCPITQAGVEAYEAFNRQLVKRRETPIAKHEVLYCERCAERNRANGAADAAERRKQVEAAIKVLRDNPAPTAIELAAKTPKTREVIEAEAVIRRSFGIAEGDEIIRAHRSSKQTKRKVSV